MRNTLRTLFILLFLLCGTACADSSKENEITHLVDDPEQTTILIGRMKESGIKFSLKNNGIVVHKDDHGRVFRMSMDIYEEFFPRYNSLAVDNESFRDEVAAMLDSHGIFYTKRTKYVKDEAPVYFLILQDSEDICKSNKLVHENIGPFTFNTKKVCE